MAVSGETVKTKKCIASGELGDRNNMLRFVLAPDMTLTLDLAEKLPGRGFWFSADKKALANIGKAKGFINRKAGGQGAKIPADLPELATTALCSRIKELFGLCQKAGFLTVGFKKTVAALREDQAFSALVVATDAAEGSVNELRLESLPHETQVISSLSMAQLSTLADSENLACVGLLQNRLSDTLARDIHRYCLLLGETAPTGKINTDLAANPAPLTSTI